MSYHQPSFSSENLRHREVEVGQPVGGRARTQTQAVVLQDTALHQQAPLPPPADITLPQVNGSCHFKVRFSRRWP